MRVYVEAAFGPWKEEEQLAKHTANFDPETHRVVLAGGKVVGFVATEIEPEFVWLVKLYLFSHSRNQGLGSALLAQVISEANAMGKAVRLRVLRVNESAQRLYARHGFSVVGEEPDRLFMVRPRGEQHDPNNASRVYPE